MGRRYSARDARDKRFVPERTSRLERDARGVGLAGPVPARVTSGTRGRRRGAQMATQGPRGGPLQEALRPGVDGWVDDHIANVQPWGIELSAVRQPTAIWHGEEDRLCTPPNARSLAAGISQAELYMVEGQGHTSLIVCRVEPTMDWIAQRVRSGAGVDPAGAR